LPRLRSERRRARGWHAILWQGYAHGKEASDSTRNALLPEGHSFPELIWLHLAEFAHGTLLLILLLLPASGLRIIPVIPWGICTAALPWGGGSVGECDLVHEPIFGIVFK
jgi:hypothetical protein